MDWHKYKTDVKQALDSGDYETAERVLLSAIEYLKANRESHERICLCLDQLGFVYVKQKNLHRAAESYTESMDLKKSVLGPNNPIVARACKKLATVVYLENKFDLAERYSKEALEIFKVTLGPGAEETRQTLEDLVALLKKMGRNVEAKILGQQLAPPEAPVEAKEYQGTQSLFDIKVCQNCSFPYDGDECIRCQS